MGEDAVNLSQPTTSDPPETFWSSTLSDGFLTLRHLAMKLEVD